MTVNEAIIQALAGFGDPVVPGLYTGESPRYYTFDYATIPAQFADNAPAYERALIQVHLFTPLDYNSIARRKETMRALTEAGLGWPDEVPASSEDKQHYVYECEAILAKERNDDNG